MLNNLSFEFLLLSSFDSTRVSTVCGRVCAKVSKVYVFALGAQAAAVSLHAGYIFDMIHAVHTRVAVAHTCTHSVCFVKESRARKRECM